ncbi:voltage gated chloride channel protein [Pelomyxa schiedti]|nr:voltage gated chloride channel protein [Pelomyxa schiedti]
MRPMSSSLSATTKRASAVDGAGAHIFATSTASQKRDSYIQQGVPGDAVLTTHNSGGSGSGSDDSVYVPISGAGSEEGGGSCSPPEFLGSFEGSIPGTGTGDGTNDVALSVRTLAKRSPAHKFESSNLDKQENPLTITAQQNQSKVARWRYFAGRWLCVAIVALVVTAFAFVLHEGMVWGRNLSWYLVDLVGYDSLSEKTASGVVFVTVGSIYGISAGLIILLLDPMLKGAATEVLCFLNGIVVQDCLKIKNLFAHTVSLTLVTASPMCVGKEGPMLAIGSQIGHAVGKVFKYDEYDTRDLVSTGLGAGIACAFGAPAGAVLFTLEKGSHFTGGLMQKLLFCTMLACFGLSFMITGVDDGKWGQFSIDSLCHFGTFPDALFDNVKQVVAFVVMGILGGIIGAIFNFLHLLVIRYRKLVFRTPLRRFIEVIAIAVLSGTIAVTMSAVLKKCVPTDDSTANDDLPTIFCPEGSYNSAATLFMNSQENAMNFLFHESLPVDMLVLTVFSICFFSISVYSIGCGVPAGFFMPSLLVGAAVGRLIGEFFKPEMETLDVTPGLMAFIGAAGVLGGVCRMPVSLSVILSEAVNEGSWSLFLMVTLIIAKFVGDMFSPSITMIDFRFKDYPILDWSAPSALRRFIVDDVMHKPVVTLSQHTTRAAVEQVLHSYTHNGFAVVCRPSGRHQADAVQGALTSSPLLGVILADSWWNC